jgi:hypothetical protein
MTTKTANRTKRTQTRRYSLNYSRILTAGRRSSMGTRAPSTKKIIRRKK